MRAKIEATECRRSGRRTTLGQKGSLSLAKPSLASNRGTQPTSDGAMGAGACAGTRPSSRADTQLAARKAAVRIAGGRGSVEAWKGGRRGGGHNLNYMCTEPGFGAVVLSVQWNKGHMFIDMCFLRPLSNAITRYTASSGIQWPCAVKSPTIPSASAPKLSACAAEALDP